MTYTEAVRLAVEQSGRGVRDLEIRWTPRLNGDGDFTGASFDARPASVPYSSGEELFHRMDEELLLMLAGVFADEGENRAETDAYVMQVLEYARQEADRWEARQAG